MPDRGFTSDADYFHLVANRANSPADRKELLKVEKEYRRLAKTDQPAQIGKSRAEFWRKRAEECRTLADTFTSKVCCEQLYRLAEAYEQMAETNELASEPRNGRPDKRDVTF